MGIDTLTATQASALLDILSHHQVYAEIREFRLPGSLDHYGPPFNRAAGRPSTSPALQSLVCRYLISLPGLKSVSTEFWQTQVHALIDDLERAELSESYDKGLLGIRKTLATATSALIESPLRGTFGGFERPGLQRKRDYDVSDPKDLSLAFHDSVYEAVYGTLLEDLAAKAAETDELSDHDPLIQALHEFVLVNLASLMHYTLILSPKGQYLLKLVNHTNKMVPYAIVKQTLRIGNVASMISGMMKVVLAKMSMASVTNWMGWTQTADEGMNLMQHIISTVLNWDIRDLESRASKIEKDRSSLQKDQLNVLKTYPSKTRQEHERIRKRSQEESRSIVANILDETSSTVHQVSESDHEQALDYLAIQLSIRDRKEIVHVLCHSQPDHLTQCIRDLVAAYEPVIRHVHNAVDLSATVGDMEHFVRDMLKMSRIHRSKDGSSPVIPTVGDFIQLLKKHQTASHRFIHQCAKNGKEVTSWYLDWAREAASHFRRGSPESQNHQAMGAGNLTGPLNNIFASLDGPQRSNISSILDDYSAYLSDLHATSARRFATVLKTPPSSNPIIKHIFSMGSHSHSRPSSRPGSPNRSPSRSHAHTPVPTPEVHADPGPGAHLARWQDLLDSTLLTPSSTGPGPVERGARQTGQSLISESNIDGERKRTRTRTVVDITRAEAEDGQHRNNKPDVTPVLDAMLPAFRDLLARHACDW